MQSSKFFQSLPVCSSLQMYSLRRIWSVLLTIARGRPLRKIYACFNAGFLVILLISTYVAIQCWRTQWSSWPTQRLHTNVARDCACIDRDTGISYDFCYSLPANRSIRGRRFSCEWLPMLKSLKLLDYAGRFIDLENSAVSFQNVVFVLAASQNHFHLALAAIANIQKNFPKTQRLVFYDLGLYSDSSNAIRRLCNVEYRKFRFSDYPEWVDRLHEFRWKPIIIAEALKEFHTIWYLDASIRMTTSDLSEIYALFNRFTNATSGGHTVKSPYLLHSATGHSTFTATHPDVYKFFPTDVELLKERKCGMYEAGFVFAIRTRQVVQDVLKWYVLCALERGCMGPRGAIGSCQFNAVDRFRKFAKCHRFDQSAVNLLLANIYDCDSRYWSSGVSTPFYRVERRAGISSEERKLLKVC